ncbi:floral homeotic protein AGAMOUS-like isoform X2 [Glycine soja]|uniref:K-box domain-containing protein n=1 Tax=Glycine max TaxID=3847 RepID=A0A0R0K318_SOYBN|nr:floral homeotic protein AGAMOUS isoform X2 [Glycine max]XP_028232907.1 floral homeotic protein AGAMOUS-like isoform X2 [Glycine soja]|eukprot:XP_006580186.1 floral homeotic protein AGAMOUS-like isoform X2 [Glycine max]
MRFLEVAEKKIGLEMVEPIILWEPVPPWQQQPISGSRILSVKASIERYKKASSDLSTGGQSASEANAQFYHQEAAKLRVQISNLQNHNSQMMGEGLSTMNGKDLKNLETKLEKGISRIRSKKNEMLFAEIEHMKKREIHLNNDNQLLRAKIAAGERSHHNVNGLSGSISYESMQSQFDSRGFFQVTGLQPNNNQYAGQDNMSLQFV